MIIITDFEQNTEEWMSARLGNPGASEFHKIIGKQGKRSTQRGRYMYDLASEILWGMPSSKFQNEAMQKGHEEEGDARDQYEFEMGTDITQVGMCFPDEQRKFHCSPDGLIPDLNKGIEIKTTQEGGIHAERMDKRTVDPTHYVQIQGSLLVTGYDSWDYVCYRKDCPLMVVTVAPDKAFMGRLQAELDEFCLELAMLVQTIREGS